MGGLREFDNESKTGSRQNEQFFKGEQGKQIILAISQINETSSFAKSLNLESKGEHGKLKAKKREKKTKIQKLILNQT